jgi:ribosomal protein S18 acetylase RimI-like enzyme
VPETRTVTVGRLHAEHWQTYRAIRLAMLKESPSAFGGTYEESASNAEADWKQRLTDNVVLLAQTDGSAAGSAMYSVRGVSDPVDCCMYGMWVDPHFRRARVGQILVKAVLAQARSAGKRRVILHVVVDNLGAKALYEREGFVATGRSKPHPHIDQLSEVEMEYVIEDHLVPTPPV